MKKFKRGKDSSVVVGAAAPMRTSRLRFAAGLGALVALVVLAAGAYALLSRHTVQHAVSKLDGSTAISKDQALRQQMVQQAGYKPNYSDYLILGNYAVTAKNYDTAETYYHRADNLKAGNFDTLYAFARLYRLKHDKKQSLHYYDLAISQANASDNPYHGNLVHLETERSAVSHGDYDLKNMAKASSDVPL